MSEFAALRSVLFAGECFFGASLILGMAWLLARRGTASQRHLTWLGAFLAMLALPLAAAVIQPGVFIMTMDAPAPIAADLTLAAAPAAAPGFTLTDAVAILLLVWLAGVAAIALKTVIGLAGVLLLRRRSVPYIPDGIDGAKFCGARWQLRLRTSPGREGPVTWGIFRPVVLLPKESVRWSRQRLEAVLLHEFAHVRRRDSLARLIALIACAFYWPNPFVWTAAARMRHEAEIAADDAVLSAGVRASSYAEELVTLAREYGQAQGSFAAITLSMAEPSGLKARVQSVLSSQSRSGATRMDILKVAALSVAMTAGLALARPSLAEAPMDDGTTTVQATAEVDTDAGNPEARIVAVQATGAPKHLTVQAVADGPDHITVSALDAPPAPEAPPAVDAPPAPLAPPAVDAPPAPPAPAAMPAPPAHMTAEQRAEFHRVMAEHRAEMRQAQAEARRARDEVRRAIADAHIGETVARALKEAEPAIRQAQGVSQAEIRRAIAKAHIAERVAEAMEKARPEIERAAAEAMEKARPEIERAAAEASRAAVEARRHADTMDKQGSEQEKTH